MDSIQDFISDNTVTIITIFAIITGTYIAQKVMNRFIRKAVEKSVRGDLFKTRRDEKLREDTIIGILSTTIQVVLWTFATLIVLAELGINLGPLIAGAGIAGVAVGFGAQSLVKDVISGVFILLENQYRVGDVVQFNQTVTGSVERFTLRTTILRDLDGMVHTIPNGEITLATNMTMDYANINLNIGVGYGDDLEKVEKVINKVGKELAEDEQWSDVIKEAPEFLRVDNFGDSSVDIKILGKTEPMQQWRVTGELRKRLKIAFDKNGIEIPFPQRVVHEAPKAKK